MSDTYRGWTIQFSTQYCVWIASQYGVEMNHKSVHALQRMIDQKIEERRVRA